MQFPGMLADRRTRSPQHTFAVETMAWEIQPILIAPVLPGETLDNFTLQARSVTPPLKSRVVGWWAEYYFFYVGFRQMPDAANLVAMFIDPSATLSASAVQAYRYYDGNGYNFVSQCLQVIVQEWFRREGETWSSYTIRSNRPAADLNKDIWLDSLIGSSLLFSGGTVASQTNIDDLERARIVMEYRRQLKLMGADGGAVDYEEILATYGASIRKAKERDRPELLRYIRDWTYPTNTVEPTTGTPTTACSWAITDRADKKRRFNEPGFIVGVQVHRPKVYYGNQTTHAASMLDRAQSWLPPVMDESGMERSLREMATGAGPIKDAHFTDSYWVDLRDLFNKGDQYIDAVAANINALDSPTTTLDYRYGTQALANALQVTADQLIITDGSINLNVKTKHVDAS